MLFSVFDTETTFFVDKLLKLVVRERPTLN